VARTGKNAGYFYFWSFNMNSFMRGATRAGLIAGGLIAAAVIGCAKAAESEITVLSREDGSGTRGAFIELAGVEEKSADGTRIDRTVSSADVTNSTAVVITNVAQNKNAIGYISLGSLSGNVKALDINGVKADENTIKAGSYPFSRPFNLVTRADLPPAAADFVAFILSPEGQEAVRKAGYISIEDSEPYQAKEISGKVVIAGSSSITPLMEKLRETYIARVPEVNVEIQQSDSTMGVNNTLDGIADIGMASRELKESETARGARTIVIALDGIALIVNNTNPRSGLSADQVRDIYTGKITAWNELP
jgi:phosphate transport system substrate-binding protein